MTTETALEAEPAEQEEVPQPPAGDHGSRGTMRRLGRSVIDRYALLAAMVLLEAVVQGGTTLAERFAAIEEEVGWRHAYDRVDLRLAHLASGTVGDPQGNCQGAQEEQHLDDGPAPLLLPPFVGVPQS